MQIVECANNQNEFEAEGMASGWWLLPSVIIGAGMWATALYALFA